MSACPGPCNAQARRDAPADERHALVLRLLAHVRFADPVAPSFRPGAPVWCPPCSQRVRSALWSLLDGYAQLELDKRHGTTAPNGVHVSGSKGRPSPSSAADEQEDLIRLLESWERTVRDLAWAEATALATSWWGPPRDDVGRMPATPSVLSGLVRSIGRWLDWALAHGDIGADLGLELLRAEARLRYRTGGAVRERRKPVPCPGCGGRWLRAEAGSSYIGCEGCGRLLTGSEYDVLVSESGRIGA